MKTLACTATEIEILARAKAGDPNAIAWLWSRHGQSIQLSMLKHAHDMGGTGTRWGEEGAIVEYNTIIVVDEDSGEVVCDEGPVEHAEPSTAPDQEGTLEAEFRSRAYDVLVRATKGFDPKCGTPFRIWLSICARNAVKDLKRKRPAGLVGKSRRAEPVARTEPNQAELEAEAAAIAERILEVRSEAYIDRWCARSDVDAVDLDIVNLNLVRPLSRNGSQPPFRNLADIAARHGISRQAVAKRRDRIVHDLIGSNKRRSDGASRNGKVLGIWLSDFQHHRISIRESNSPYRQHRGQFETLVNGQWRPVNPCDPVRSLHQNGKITDAEFDLIQEHQSAFEAFAHGTGFNLYWRSAFKDAPKKIETTSPSTDDLRSFFEGEPDGAVRLLTETQKEALQTIARCRDEFGLDRKPEAQRVPVRVRWAQLFYSYPSDFIKRRRKLAPAKPFFVRTAWRCDGFEPLIAAPPLQPENEHEFAPIVSTVSTQGA